MKLLEKSGPVPSVDSSDAELVSLALAGSDPAFAQIMRRYNRVLFRTARSIVKNDDDAQEALQDAYLRAWRALAGFRAEARLSTWLVRIVVNEALGRLRRTGAQILPLHAAMDVDEEPPEMHMPANPNDQPEASAMRAQLRQQMEARIDALPDSFRLVFMLRGVEEMSAQTLRWRWTCRRPRCGPGFSGLAVCCEKACRAISTWRRPMPFRLPARAATASSSVC